MKMKKCSKCGLDNIDSATKCLFCDTPFDDSTIHSDEAYNSSNSNSDDNKPIEAEIVEEKIEVNNNSQTSNDTKKEKKVFTEEEKKRRSDKDTYNLSLGILFGLAFIFNVIIGWTVFGTVSGLVLTIACVVLFVNNLKNKGSWIFNVLTIGMIAVSLFNVIMLIFRVEVKV